MLISFHFQYDSLEVFSLLLYFLFVYFSLLFFFSKYHQTESRETCNFSPDGREIAKINVLMITLYFLFKNK